MTSKTETTPAPGRKTPTASASPQRSTAVRASPRSALVVPKTLTISVGAEFVKDAMIVARTTRMN